MLADTAAWPIDKIRTYVTAQLPLFTTFNFTVAEASRTGATVELLDGLGATRPGGIIAGPVLFAMADVAVYCLALGSYGDPNAATVDMSINFLRPANAPLIARATPLKLGRRLLTAEITMTSADKIVAKAISTWVVSAEHLKSEPG